jgi:hypothetical protein
MGLGKVVVGHGRRLRPLEQHVAPVVICLSTYDDGVRACADLHILYTEGAAVAAVQLIAVNR